MKKILKPILTAFIALLCIPFLQAQSCADGSYEFSDMVAIFQSNGCTGCHGSQGGLNLSNYNNVVMGGNNGSGGCGPYSDPLSFLIGKIDGSLIQGDNCGNAMPRNGTPFGTPGMSAADIAAIQEWIDDGAPEFCAPSCATVDLDIRFDGFPAQTSWNITDAGGNVVASSTSYSGVAGNSLIIENNCLFDGCYTLNFFDSVNNGMCPFRATATSAGTFITPGTVIAPGSVVATLGTVVAPGLCGNYTLTDANGTVLASGGGSFGASETNSFCLSGGIAPIIFQGGNVHLKTIQDAQIRIIPNVINDQATLYYSLKTNQDIHIQIVDITGKIIEQYTRNFNDTNEINLNVNNLQSGFYFVQLMSGDIMLTEKFVKK